MRFGRLLAASSCRCLVRGQFLCLLLTPSLSLVFLWSTPAPLPVVPINYQSSRPQVKDDKRDGWGVFYFADGKVYEGAFAKDKTSGTGLMREPNGATYPM